MKKILLLALLICTLFMTGCGGLFESNVVPNEESITLRLDDDFSSVIEGDLPTFTFNFEGSLNTVKNVNKSFYTVFANNEDKVLSDALTKLFEQYKDRMYVETIGSQSVNTTLFSTLNEFGAVVNEEYTPDDYMVYEETAYISLENGLKLTVDYRRFVYNGENYYTWRYTNSITMYLYYPMMALENGLTNKLVLISLPNRVTFSVGPSLKLESILNGVTYIDDEDCMYYTFNYVNLKVEKEEDLLKAQQQYVIDYYVNELNGEYNEYEEVVEGEKVIRKEIQYSYLGNDFIVKLYDKNFKMNYVGKSK